MKKLFLIILILCVFCFSAEADDDLFPPKYDLRTLGFVPAVSNQGTDRTCWTFAATASITSNYLMNVEKYGDYLKGNSDLSELHLAWFSFKNTEQKKNFAYVKNGNVIANPSNSEIMNHSGNPQMALAFLSRHDGPAFEKDLPYSGNYPAEGTSPRDYKTALRITGARYIEDLDFSFEDEGSYNNFVLSQDTIIKAAVCGAAYSSYGAVDVGVYWDNNYMSDKFAYYNPNSRRSGHAVTIIGWDDNYSRENFGFIKPSKDGAWLVMNSWGNSWGNNGCFWMSYEQPLRYAMSFNTEPFNPRIREYLHDDLGFTNEVALPDTNIEDGVAIAANVFKVRGDHEKLREIGTYFTKSALGAVALIFDLGTENSLAIFEEKVEDEEFLVNIELAESYSDRGYYVQTLTEPVPLSKDHYFAIGMMVDKSENKNSNSKPTFAAEVKLPDYRTANAEINAGETYFRGDNDKWYDAKDYTFMVGDKEVTGFNACIKGFTYIPDERFADDWTIISSDGKVQLSIPLLLEAAPEKISVTGKSIENVLHKIELENSDTGGAKGNFYTLKLICDVKSEDAAITSMIIDGTERISGHITNKKMSDNNFFDKIINVAETGVSLNGMNFNTGSIEDTKGYEANNDFSHNVDTNNNSTNNNSGSGGGCNTNFGVLFIVLFALTFIHKNFRY